MLIVVDENIPGAHEAFGPLGTVRSLPGRDLRPTDLRDADALIVRSVTRVDEALLAGSNIHFVGTATIGVDHIDRDYLAHAGIGFASAAGCNARSVVEYVLAALLEIATTHNTPLSGKTLGIVGHGNIGSRLARVAPALGLRVLLNDPPLQRAGHPGPFTPLPELLAHSDFITLHVPKVKDGPDRTTGLLDEQRLATIKPGAWLINSSRGDVVVGSALHQALASGHLAGAVLDVWENEPAIDTRLMEAVFLATPHIAGYSMEGKMNGTTLMHDALVKHFHLQHSWQPDMPPPADPIIEIDTSDNSAIEQLLAPIVRRSYHIREDDARLRAGKSLPDPQWRLHFDRLRRQYPVRREFANYTIVVPPQFDHLQDTLRHLGFRIERRPTP